MNDQVQKLQHEQRSEYLSKSITINKRGNEIMSDTSTTNGRAIMRIFSLALLMSVASLASAAVNNNPSIGLVGALSGANTLLLGVPTGEQYKATLSWPSDASGHHPRTGRYKFEVDTPAGQWH